MDPNFRTFSTLDNCCVGGREDEVLYWSGGLECVLGTGRAKSGGSAYILGQDDDPGEHDILVRGWVEKTDTGSIWLDCY